MKTRIAFAYTFHDVDWLGGRNYFASLFTAVQALAPDDFEFVFVTGTKTRTTLPDSFRWMPVLRTPMLDRLHPAWFARQVTARACNVDPLLAVYLGRHGVHVLSHGGPLTRSSKVLSLPWLYDFQFLHLPQYWEARHVRWAEQRYRAAARHGTGVIVSSRDALRDLETFVPDCRVPRHVLPFVSTPVDVRRLATATDLRARYDLPERYIFLPNQFWANKNHALVLEALARLERDGVAATVVCTGKTVDGRQPDHVPALLRRRSELGLERSFRVLGVVPYPDAQSLMAHACAVLNPSRFEGWSTTVEEAKTLDRPLLLSDIAVHREQAPERGRFFGPDDADRLAELLRDALRAPPEPPDPDAIERSYERRLRAFGDRYLAILRETVSARV